jgi:hypothetical protein
LSSVLQASNINPEDTVPSTITLSDFLLSIIF